MRDVDRLIEELSEAVRERLEANADKPGWQGLSFQELKRLADAEVLEFGISLYIFENKMTDRLEALKAMRHEATDVIDYYSFIVQKTNTLIAEMEG